MENLNDVWLSSTATLTNVECINNARLLSFDLSHQLALQLLVYINNSSVVKYDVSACTQLSSINMTFMNRLAVLYLTSLTCLHAVVCAGNPRITAVKAVGCTAFRTMECSCKQSHEFAGLDQLWGAYKLALCEQRHTP